MKKQTKKLILFFTILASTYSTTKPVAFKKAFSKAMTCAHWAISAGPFVGSSLGNIYYHYTKKGREMRDNLITGGIDEPTQQEKEFCYKQLDILDVNDKDNISIKRLKDGNFFSAQKTIYIKSGNIITKLNDLEIEKFAASNSLNSNLYKFKDDSIDALLNQKKKLQELLNKENNNPKPKSFFSLDFKKIDLEKVDQKLNECAGFIQHEAGHIHLNHIPKGIATCFSAPFITHAISKIPSLIRKKPNKTYQYSIIKSLLKIPSAFIKIPVSLYLLRQYEQNQEYQADDFIQDDPKILRAMAKFSKKHHEITERLKPNNNNYENRFINWLNEALSAHPSSLKRAQRFEKRIEKIEERETN